MMPRCCHTSRAVKVAARALHSVSTRSLPAQNSQNFHLHGNIWSHPPTTASIQDGEIDRLAASPRRPVTLADLVRHGRPPLTEAALLASANFTLSLLPARLAHRVVSLRNLPFIVVANPHISKIYNNYLHSLSTLEPFYSKPIVTMQDEEKFTGLMADLVETHANTIPMLAQGLMECKKYIDPVEVTKFLDQHLRARIGTRLIAEQHIALHLASTAETRQQTSNAHLIGVIDTALRPASIIRSCENWVGDICELKYGVRPSCVIDGEIDAEFAHVPVHLEYIMTELLKNAFRATVEAGRETRPIEITIAAAPYASTSKLEALRKLQFHSNHSHDFTQEGLDQYCSDFETGDGLLNAEAQHITVRIRDVGGGIAPEIQPHIWAYSFTTFDAEESATASASTPSTASVDTVIDGLNAITNGGNPSSIAGLGYGLPLSRAYAEYFGGSIKVQSMHGWGTDVYLELQGIGKIA